MGKGAYTELEIERWRVR